MYPSYHQVQQSNEFKSEPIQYDPYFPSQVSSTSSSIVTSTGMTPDSAEHYNTYQQQPHQQQQPQNGGCYNQYSSQNWTVTSHSPPGSQPSPQYFGPGPGPGDGGGNGVVGGGGTNGNNHNGAADFAASYNNQSYNPPPQNYYSPPPQQCNQYDQYNQYNFNGQQQQQQWHPPPGASPPLFGYGNIKSEHYEMKPSPPHCSPMAPPPQQQSHPGAIPHPYYQGDNGHVSPHSPHLMGMSPVHQQPQQPPQPQAGGLSPMGMYPGDLPGGWGPPGGVGGNSLPGAAGKKRPGNPNKLESQHHYHQNQHQGGGQPKITDHAEFKTAKKPRSNTSKRTTNRFNGMSEEEVAKRGLPDYLKPGLDIVFIGINPSMFAAYTGKYYDGPGNHFWQALYLSGILSEPMSAVDDHKLLDLGIGFTNIVPRTTRGLSDLSRKEIADGAEVLREKLCNFKPKIAVFNGKAIYEVYSGQKKFMFGRQPEPLNDGATWLWVMPSSSARCAQLPRAVDKVPFFEALRKFRDYLTGKLAKIEDCEVVFANVSLRNWTAIKTDSTDTDDINPNLQPYCDGVPANVPLSVCEVIEDVIRQYSLDGGPGPTDQTSSSSVPNTPVSACSQNSMHPPLGSEESDCNTVGSVGSSNSNM